MILLERRKLKEENRRRSVGQSEVDGTPASEDIEVTNVAPGTSCTHIGKWRCVLAAFL